MTKGVGLLYQKGDYPGSVKQFQRAIAAYPDFYEAYAQMEASQKAVDELYARWAELEQKKLEHLQK